MANKTIHMIEIDQPYAGDALVKAGEWINSNRPPKILDNVSHILVCPDYEWGSWSVIIYYEEENGQTLHRRPATPD